MNQPPIRILCVDDEQDASKLLERHLSRDYECVTVESASAAIEALENNGQFAVVVSDYLMPNTDGVELFQRIKARWPLTARVMVTADEHFDIAVAALNDANVYRFVRKPWQASEIRQAVDDAVQYFRLTLSEQKLRDELARTNYELDQRLVDLDEANELLEYWVEFSPAVLYSFSLENDRLRASYISKNFTRLSGYERTEAVIDADFWSELIIADDRAKYQKVLSELCSGALNHAVLEYTVTHRTGDKVRVVDSLKPVHDGDGNTVEIVGAWLDVSARR